MIFGFLGVAAIPASVTWLLDPSKMVGVGSEVLASSDDVDMECAGERAGGVKWAAIGDEFCAPAVEDVVCGGVACIFFVVGR